MKNRIRGGIAVGCSTWLILGLNRTDKGTSSNSNWKKYAEAYKVASGVVKQQNIQPCPQHDPKTSKQNVL